MLAHSPPAILSAPIKLRFLPPLKYILGVSCGWWHFEFSSEEKLYGLFNCKQSLQTRPDTTVAVRSRGASSTVAPSLWHATVWVEVRASCNRPDHTPLIHVTSPWLAQTLANLCYIKITELGFLHKWTNSLVMRLNEWSWLCVVCSPERMLAFCVGTFLADFDCKELGVGMFLSFGMSKLMLGSEVCKLKEEGKTQVAILGELTLPCQ